MKEYLAYYQQKLITPCRGVSGDHWESQTRFQELPRYLHDEKRRPKVITALARALEEFAAEDPWTTLEPNPHEEHFHAVHARWKARARQQYLRCWTTVDRQRGGALTYHVEYNSRHFSFASREEIRECIGLLKAGYYFQHQSTGYWRDEIANAIAMPATARQGRYIAALERALRQFPPE